MNTEPLWSFVNERHAIYIRKSLREGLTPESLHVPSGCDLEEADPEHFALASKGPLTNDQALNQYRYCNVFRELDRVTLFVKKNIRERFADNPNLWIMLAIARTINWPATLEYLINHSDRTVWPHDESFQPAALARAMTSWALVGNKVYTGAYMIRAESNPNAEWYSWTKHRYIAEIVIGRLWEDRRTWQDFLTTDDPNDQKLMLRDVWELFQTKRYIGWGPFMAYQVVVDMRHTHYLRNAPDINTWSALGPGSRRGLNRLAGRPVDFALSQDQGLEEMIAIFKEQDDHRALWVPHIDLSDIQNCLCETDKYLRVLNGEGRPRAVYVPGRGY